MGGTKENINKETEDLNNTIDRLDLTDMCKSLYPTTAENTHFSRTNKTFSMRDHMLGHKRNLNFKKTESIMHFLKLQSNEIRNKQQKENRKIPKMWK